MSHKHNYNKISYMSEEEKYVADHKAHVHPVITEQSMFSQEEKERMENQRVYSTDVGSHTHNHTFTTTSPMLDFSSKETFKTGKVANCNKLNLRETPGLDGKVLEILKAGTVLILGDTDGEWDEVLTESGEIRGYVMSKYVEL